ncbi:amidohydrolase family protein [Desulfobacter latus]|uniref:Amidohydrolase family protein n=1 Tax=Desulfobacter latus TaxID=2292 RepID=A0A850TFE7_9BACT|nr:amidohydrolase family protein [Desulfobacter latus]NWH06176.1 amidohydrolase family protein [Desulfobacter latus]
MVAAAQNFLAKRSGPKEEWLLGQGWNQDKLVEKRYPLKADLYAISMETPILFTRVCRHISVCNTTALERVDLSKAGHLKKYIDMESGLFQEDALNLLYNTVPSSDIPAIKSMLVDAATDLVAAGVTSVQSDDLCCMPDQDYKKVLQAYQELHREQALPVRVYQQCLFFEAQTFKSFVEDGYRTGQGDDFFKIGPLKLLLDGSLGRNILPRIRQSS